MNMKKQAYIVFIILMSYQLLFAQTRDVSTENQAVYESLKNEFLFMLQRQQVDPDTSQVFDFLKFIESNGQWDAGIAFLQNFLSDSDSISENYNLPELSLTTKSSDPLFNAENKKNHFPVKFYIGTGIDYSENSFEVLNLDQDSLLISKVTSPAFRAGINIEMDSFHLPVSINSLFSYDQLLTNFSNQINLAAPTGFLPYLKYQLNRVISNDTSNYNFWENKIEIGREWNLTHWQLDIASYYRIKQYDRETEATRSYTSIFLSAHLQRKNLTFLNSKGLYFEYFRLNKMNYDELESYGYGEWQFPFIWDSGQITTESGYLVGKYKYIYSDQILKNSYQDIILIFDLRQKARSSLYVRWKSESFLRKYADQNEYETNFYYLKEKAGLEMQFRNNISTLGLYFIDEREIHYTSADSFNVDDYHSTGFGINLFLAFSSINLYLDYEYLNKKTPSSIYDFISYNQPSRNHNIMSTLTWNLSRSISLNMSISFMHSRNLREKNNFLTNYMNAELLYSF